MNCAPRSRRRPPAIASLVLALTLTGCHDPHPAKRLEVSWSEARATFRAGLEERNASWGGLPAADAARRAHLGELATHGRSVLRAVRARPEPVAASVLASLLPPSESEETTTSLRQHSYQGRGYSMVVRRIPTRGGTAWLDLIDLAGAPDLIVPLEVKRVVGRSRPDGPYRTRTIGGFAAIETELAPESPLGLISRTLEIEVEDRILVVARGDRGVSFEDLERLVGTIDLTRVASAIPSHGRSASEPDHRGTEQPSDDG